VQLGSYEGGLKMLREIAYDEIVSSVRALCMDANYSLGQDVMDAFKTAYSHEKSEVGKEVLNQLVSNAEIAKQDKVPMCQDTGMAVFFIELGQDCHIVGGSLYKAVNEGVRQGYLEGYLRASIVNDPLERRNTGDNTPAIIHLELVEGDRCTIHLTAKGFGSENMSRLKMLQPSDGLAGIIEFVLETVKLAGPNACPPMVVGVGIGGNFEKVGLLAKKSLFRPIGERHAKPELADLERELLVKINALGIGPQGMGGSTTALDVHVEVFGTHIAGLPVAVNINCHASRHKTAEL
jgi:fumarate hydratase subunit alpha